MENFNCLENYFGLIFCKILPPSNFYIPVLPFKTNNKLMFLLCPKCCEENINACSHTDDERALEGTWVILEILEAIKLNSRIIQIYEIWHYEETDQYNPCDKKGGLLTEYVNNFLKIKQEASGFPEWVESQQDKLTYINDYKRNEGLSLEYDKI
jgi:hypothetical protein